MNLLILYKKDMGQQQSIGDYAFNREIMIGSGASAKVYRGSNKKLKREVAVKIYKRKKEGAYEQYMRQKKVLEKMQQHEHIIKYYGSNESQDELYLFLQLCEGGTLKEYIEEGISEWEALRIFKQVVEAVKFMHNKTQKKYQFIHRDLNPENILLTKNGDIKLSDFGISKERTSNTFLDMTPNIGTLYYIAPEVGKNSSSNLKYGSSCDVWSAGVMFHEILANKCFPKFFSFPKQERYDLSLQYVCHEWNDLIHHKMLIDQYKRFNFEKISNYIKDNEKKMREQMLKRYGYKLKQGGQYFQKERKKNVNLTRENSMKKLTLTTQYLHFMRDRLRIFLDLVDKIQECNNFCVHPFYDLFLKYLSVSLMINKMEEFKKILEKSELSLSFGKVSIQSFVERDKNYFTKLMKVHKKKVTGEFQGWKKKEQEFKLKLIEEMMPSLKGMFQQSIVQKTEKDFDRYKKMWAAREYNSSVKQILRSLMEIKDKIVCRKKLKIKENLQVYMYLLIINESTTLLQESHAEQKNYIYNLQNKIENSTIPQLEKLIKQSQKVSNEADKHMEEQRRIPKNKYQLDD